MGSVWSEDAVSVYPLSQPMVGQEKFYNYYNNFVDTLGSARMARIFPLIADWGIGKSRIGFEIVSEVIGKDKGWIIRGEDNSSNEVRILKDNFEDGILPIYISYSDMNHEDLAWDEWVAFGAYVALKGLVDANRQNSGNRSFREKVAKDLVDHLEPLGFSTSKLKDILQIDRYSEEELLDIDNQGIVDKIVKEAYNYFNSLGIEHFMVIADEVESETETNKLKASNEKIKKKLDGDAIQLISHAIKHEDVRSKHPYVSFLLLCSPAIGDQFRGLGALDRRMDKCEIKRNSFADINYFIENLKEKGLVRDYPEGLVEAAYTIAGGNFGWFNLIMAKVDQYLQNNNGQASTDEIFKHCINSVARFEKLLDKSSLEVINVEEKHRPLVEKLLLLQLPKPIDKFSNSELQALKNARTEYGEKIIKEFKLVELKKPEVARFLVHQGDYEDIEEGIYSNKYGGEFDLDLMLKSIKTFSLGTKEDEYLVGAEKEVFINQIRMLYPEEEAERAAELLYDLIQDKIEPESTIYIGPSFSFLSRFNKQYTSDTGQAGYLINNDANQKLEEHIDEIKKDRENQINRVLTGFCRVIKENYPKERDLDLNLPAKRIQFLERPISLLVHPENIVDVIWGQDTDKLREVLKNKKIAQEGVHPIFVLSSSTAIRDDIIKIKNDLDRIGRGIIFLALNKVQMDDLEVCSVDQDYLDIRDSKSFTRAFRERINRINDEINDKAKEWFERVDIEGWVLRPIKPDTKKNDSIVRDIAKVYKRLLINDYSFMEAISRDEGLEEEIYERVKKVLPKLDVPGRLSTKGYKTIGIFEEKDDDYRVQIPACFSRLLSYVGDSRRSEKDIEKDFYFSLQEAVSRGKSVSKIIKQIRLFLQELGVIEVEEHFNRVTENTLKVDYHNVKNWLDEEYEEIIDQLAGVLNINYINEFRTTKKEYYQRKLSDAQNILSEIKIDKLQKAGSKNRTLWKDIIEKLDLFYDACKYIYDKDRWNDLSFNEPAIERLKPLEDTKPIWERLRLIQLFHTHINKLKKPAADKIQTKINEIYDSNEYKDFEIPVSPITLMLKEYKKELDYSTNADKTQSVVLVNHITDTLAFKLKNAEYKEALDRLRRILSECGLQWSQENGIEWNESGLIVRYSETKKKLKKIIDDFLNNKPRIERWNKFFSSAPDEWKNYSEYKRMNKLSSGLELFLKSGLKQKIDDEQDDNGIKALLGIMEEEVNNNLQLVGQLKGVIESVENFVKEKNKSWYEKDMIEAVNKIRKMENKSPFIYKEQGELPEEESYQKAKGRVEKLMNSLRVEGNKYFENMQTTFDFFIKVINDINNINWGNHKTEESELINKGLIRIKREVV